MTNNETKSERVAVKCPYCGYEFITIVQEDEFCGGWIAKVMAYCEREDGGCDQDFLIEVCRTVKIKRYHLLNNWQKEVQHVPVPYK